MSKILSLVILLPLALLLVVFSVLNRAPVTLSMDAFGTTPQFSLQAPVFVVVLGALILGILIGGIATFVTQARHRSRAARREQEVDKLRREVAASNERVRALREERERVESARRGETAGTALPAAPSKTPGLAAAAAAPGLPAPRAA